MSRVFTVYKKTGEKVVAESTSPVTITGLESGGIYPEGYFKVTAIEDGKDESAKVDVPAFTTLYTNIAPAVKANSFTLGDGATVVDGDDGEVIFSLDGTKTLIKYNTAVKLPKLTDGNTYTISADIKFHSDIVGDVRNLRLSYNYLPGGQPELQTTTPIQDTTKDKWLKIKGTNTVKYGDVQPNSWYLLLRDMSTANKISGTISLKNIQIVEGAQPLPKPMD